MPIEDSSDIDPDRAPEPKAEGEDIKEFVSEFDKLPSVQLYDDERLRAMQQAELVFHANRLQHAYRELANDHAVLTWEYNENRVTLTNLSRAAKLAHQLSISDLGELATVAVTEISQYFNCGFGALFVFRPETGLLESSHSTTALPDSGQYHRKRDAGHFLIKLFFEHTEPFLVDRADSSGFVIADTGERVAASVPGAWNKLLGERALAFPLQMQRPEKKKGPLVLGGLLIGDARVKLETKDAEVAVLFADLLASNLFNAMLVQKLNEMTIIDPLTGIFNRRHLVARLNAAIVQARRQKHALSLVMLDIDHFKRVNDTHGHLAGDKVLKETAGLLKNSVRQDVDLPARYGGEEFIAILPYTSLETGAIVAERIRGALKGHTFELDDGQRLNVTGSLGVAQYANGESMETFIDRVDSALYQAKRGGRDRVAFAGQESRDAGTNR